MYSRTKKPTLYLLPNPNTTFSLGSKVKRNMSSLNSEKTEEEEEVAEVEEVAEAVEAEVTILQLDREAEEKTMLRTCR
jgi:hypothetical protein